MHGCVGRASRTTLRMDRAQAGGSRELFRPASMTTSFNPPTKLCESFNNLDFLLVLNAGAFQKKATAVGAFRALCQPSVCS